MRFLEKFMDSLASNPIVKNTQIFMDFVSIENETQFNERKKEYGKVKTPTKLTEMRTIDGTLKTRITKDSDVITESIKNYSALNEVIIKKLCGAHKSLFVEMNQVSTRMKEISDLYSQLHFVSEKSKDVLKIIYIFIYNYLTLVYI